MKIWYQIEKSVIVQKRLLVREIINGCVIVINQLTNEKKLRTDNCFHSFELDIV